MDPSRRGSSAPRGRRSAPAPLGAPDPGRRLRRLRAPRLPDATQDFVMRSHTLSALCLELAVAAIVTFIAVDALRRSSWLVGAMALVAAVGVAFASVAAYRRSTRTSPEGLVVTTWGERRLAWVDIDGFELAPHRTGRRDQICAVLHGERIPFPHPDARSLALRPELARRWYQSLVERIEARRPSVG